VVSNALTAGKLSAAGLIGAGVVFLLGYRAPALAGEIAAAYLGLMFAQVFLARSLNPALVQRIFVPLAIALAVLGGAWSPALVIAGAFLFLLAVPPTGVNPFPLTRALLFIWLIAEAMWEIWRLTGGESFVLHDWFLEAPRLLRQLEIVSAFFVFTEIARRPEGLKLYVTPLKWVLSLAAVALLTQAVLFYFLTPTPGWLTETLNPFFAQQNRFAGAFVDPNAAGIVFAGAAILFSAYLSRVRYGWAFLAGALAALMMTGSRSGLLIYAVYLGVTFLSRGLEGSRDLSQRLFHRRLFLVLSSIALPVVALNVVPVTTLSALPPGLERAALSVRYDTMPDALFSRGALWQAGIAQFSHAPLLGVGLDRFREMLPPFAQALSLEIGTWNDNPGSWPLFILVELGLIGGLFLAFDLSRLRFLGSAVPTGLAMSVGLLFGCHLHDGASAIVYGIAAAFTLERLRRPCGMDARLFRFEPRVVPLIVVLLPFIIAISQRFPRGLYQWELHNGVLARWSTGNASLEALCRNNGIVIKSLAPAHIKQTVTIGELDGAQAFDLTQPMPLRGLSCGAVGADQNETARRKVRLSVSPTWIPAEMNVGSDPRSLGVLLLFPQPIDLDAV
jgi:hypothetical protein